MNVKDETGNRKGKQNFNQQDWNNQLLTFLKENIDYVL